MSNLQHIAIIMDGNGRWAEDLKAPRALGHKQGAQAVQNIINYSIYIYMINQYPVRIDWSNRHRFDIDSTTNRRRFDYYFSLGRHYLNHVI